jgi:hypothetical protein
MQPQHPLGLASLTMKETREISDDHSMREKAQP